jgi:hypothetical protein
VRPEVVSYAFNPEEIWNLLTKSTADLVAERSLRQIHGVGYSQNN